MNKKTVRNVFWVVAGLTFVSLAYKIYQFTQGDADTRTIIGLGCGILAFVTLASSFKDNEKKKL